MSHARFEEKIHDWVKDALKNPKNLATEVEIFEQSKVALKLFIESDYDGSDWLSFDELKSLCDTMGLPMGNDEEEVLMKMDTDDSGSLDIEEWTKWWLNRVSTLPNPLKQQEVIARNTFGKFDSDQSGFIDSAELNALVSALGADFTDEELAEALKEIDEDSSGKIDSGEFVAWWTNRAANNRRNGSLISLKMRKLAAKAAQIFHTDIFSASWKGDAELVKSFVDSEQRMVHAADSELYGDGWTALHYACYQGHAEVVRTLLSANASVNKANDLGFTPLFYAAQRGHIAICEALMEANADPCLYGHDSENEDLFDDSPPQDHRGGNPHAASVSAAHGRCAGALDAGRH